MKKVAAVLLTLCVIGAMYLNSPLREELHAPLVEVASIRTVDARDVVRLRGSVTERARYELFPAGASVVESVFVSVGERVSAGQSLMALRLTQAAPSLASLYSELASRITPNEAHLAVMPQTDGEGEYYELISPVDGTVTALYARAGDVVSGALSCAAVSDLTRLGVSAEIGEDQAALIRAGMRCTVRVSALSDDEYLAFISTVAPFASASTTLLGQKSDVVTAVELTLEDAEGLLPGYTADIRVTVEEYRDLPILPYECVAQDVDGEYVMVVGADMRLYRRAVVTGKELTEGVEVVSGVAEEDRVAVEPERYSEGERVRTA